MRRKRLRRRNSYISAMASRVLPVPVAIASRIFGWPAAIAASHRCDRLLLIGTQAGNAEFALGKFAKVFGDLIQPFDEIAR